MRGFEECEPVWMIFQCANRLPRRGGIFVKILWTLEPMGVHCISERCRVFWIYGPHGVKDMATK